MQGHHLTWCGIDHELPARRGPFEPLEGGCCAHLPQVLTWSSSDAVCLDIQMSPVQTIPPTAGPKQQVGWA